MTPRQQLIRAWAEHCDTAGRDHHSHKQNGDPFFEISRDEYIQCTFPGCDWTFAKGDE